ncbi:MAG: hypothetical protein JXB39_10010, partial [Deltaproteobacteria bacterium]|nr:hypothetical protein [Deltaproteobacteria bacterium]
MIRSHPLSVPFFFLLPALGGCPISSDGPGGGPGGPGGGQPMGLDLAQAAPQFTQDQVRAGEHVRISGTVVGSECTGRIRIDFIDRSVSGPGGGKGAGPGGGQGQGMGPGGGQGQGISAGGGQGQGMGPGGGQGQGMG